MWAEPGDVALLSPAGRLRAAPDGGWFAERPRPILLGLGAVAAAFALGFIAVGKPGMGLAALADITGELSNLADAILDFAYRQIREQLTARHGQPLVQGPDGQSRPCGFAVIALGKLGGQELNYSSDIDLMFLYSANGVTDGAA